MVETKFQVLDVEPEVSLPAVGIDDPDRRRLANGLAIALADTYVLYMKTQATHWNIVGPLFYSVHKLTEDQYGDLADAIDAIAERIRALGYLAPATYERYATLSNVEASNQLDKAGENLEQLASDHEGVAARLRKIAITASEHDDVYTADLLTRRIGSHEKAAWMLRSLVAK